MNIKTNLHLPQDLQDEIADFAFKQIGKFRVNSAGLGRRFCNLNLHDIDISQKVKAFSKESYKALGIDTVNEEHIFGNFIGVNSGGAFVHEHSDPDRDDGFWHVRLNFMIQKPVSGGDVVIDGNTYVINERDSWINFASKWRHSSTPVSGSQHRVVLSMGNYIEPQQALELLNRITQG
jgi:hypothetical protein